MRTTPSAIEQFLTRDGAVAGAIVKLTDGSSTWYLGTHSMPRFSEGHVYPILSPSFVTSEKINIYTKQWGVSNVRLSILNGPYCKDASFDWIRFCNEIGSLNETNADLYLFAGPNVTQVSDCLHRFSGKIIKHPTYDSEKITIEIVDKWVAADLLIPQTLMSDVYSDCPEEVANKYIPLVYGTFTFDVESPYGGKGMAMGYPTVKGEKPKFVFADHVLYAITDLWAPRIGSFPLEYTGHTLVADDSGRGTGVGTGTYLWLWMWPTDTDDQGHSFPANKPTNASNMHDKSFTTYAVVKDNVADSCPSPAFIIGIGWVSFDEDQEDALMSLLQANDSNGYDTTIEVTYKCDSLAAAEPGTGVVEIHYQTGAELSNAMTADNTIRTSTFTMTSALYGAKDKRINLAVEWSVACADASGTIGDDILNNADMMNVYELMMKAGFYFRGGLSPYNMQDNRGQVANEKHGFAVCTGREFGSWITESGRSIGRSPGDYIDQVVFQVESLCRDELGMTTADIDTASIDDVAGTGVDGRLNQLEREKCSDVIRKLSEQSTFVFFVDGASLARTIRLNNTSPTTDITIPASHITAKRDNGPPNIVVGKSGIYCDQIVTKYRWQQEYEQFRLISTTGSGDFIGHYEWPALDISEASTIRTHLAGATGIWSTPHVTVEFQTKGLTYAHLEVGDWIELDDTSIDPHIECYGASWSGKQFLVVQVTQNGLKGTKIKAIELYT